MNKPTFETTQCTFESDTNSQVTIHSEEDVNKSEKWREEFESKFLLGEYDSNYSNNISLHKIIDFISNLLSEERNKVRAILDRYYACGGHLCEDKLIKELEELVK